ncbi:MAG: ROK family protein [Aquimonas sp.]|jgi:fructokinase
MNPTAPLLAAIEAGGTKCWVEVGHGRDHVLAQTRIDTRDGPATLAAIDAWLRSVETVHGPIAGVGVAAFGPVRLDPNARDHGCVLTTPKPGWQGADWRSLARHRRNCGFAVETDVNAAALAEARWGDGRGCESLVYVTVGTGIGGGWVIGGRAVHGLLHPELGHLKLRRHPRDQSFAGSCPFHGDCVEGVASGVAIHARYGCSLSELSEDHPALDIVADALGQLCASLVLVGSAQRILLGGGVMADSRLLPRVRLACERALAGYLEPGFDAACCIRAPGLGERSGRAGAFLLAAQAVGGLHF